MRRSFCAALPSTFCREASSASAVRHPGQYPAIRISGTRATASHCCPIASEAGPNRCPSRVPHGSVAVQWRNADRTKSLRPPTGIPMQASRQLVAQARFCGPINVPSCADVLVSLPAGCAPFASVPVCPATMTNGSDLLQDFLKRFPSRFPAPATFPATLKSQRAR